MADGGPALPRLPPTQDASGELETLRQNMTTLRSLVICNTRLISSYTRKKVEVRELRETNARLQNELDAERAAAASTALVERVTALEGQLEQKNELLAVKDRLLQQRRDHDNQGGEVGRCARTLPGARRGCRFASPLCCAPAVARVQGWWVGGQGDDWGLA